MKLKLARFDGFGSNLDITIGKYYDVEEVFDGIHEDCYEFIDDRGDSHKLRKECFESVVECPGEGLPPVGTICEILHSGQGKFMEAEVVGFHKNDAIVYVKELFKYLPYGIEHIYPIKSEKDKEIEEIVNLYEDAMPVEAFAKKLYEHGYRKTK